MSCCLSLLNLGRLDSVVILLEQFYKFIVIEVGNLGVGDNPQHQIEVPRVRHDDWQVVDGSRGRLL